MSAQITRRLKPEEKEILRKREELAAIRGTLAERELELADLQRQLAIFEGTYLRQVGALYAELDDWEARILLLRAQIDPSENAAEKAEEARDQAHRTYEAAHGEASKTREVPSSPELKGLFREAAKRIHPDFAVDSADLERRTRFMAEANRAYQANDVETLQRILDEFVDGSDEVKDEGIGAELIRIIRQIFQAQERIVAIEHQMETLRESEIAKLKRQADEAEQQGRDLLAELAAAVREKITLAKKEHEGLTREAELR